MIECFKLVYATNIPKTFISIDHSKSNRLLLYQLGLKTAPYKGQGPLYCVGSIEDMKEMLIVAYRTLEQYPTLHRKFEQRILRGNGVISKKDSPEFNPPSQTIFVDWFLPIEVMPWPFKLQRTSQQ